MLPTSILTTTSRRREVDESLNNVAYRKIKDKIIALVLPPASLIDEAYLAKELGIGLTPVRQALRRLALENLVVILPRRGTMVADLNFSDLQKIFEMRLELEALAAQQAAVRATPDQLSEMENLLAQTLLTEHDNQQLIALDRAIHALIARCAHNEFLEQTLDWLYCHVLRLWHISLNQMDVLSEAMDEHWQILAALKTGNSERAGLIMRAHVQHFQASFQRTFQPEQSIPERWSATPVGLEGARPTDHKNSLHPLMGLRDPLRSV
ncbi:MAG: GntR family transcriptional regulator [Chloroflexi bacterium]|nr:GntR family transcriptional regulator [Chloroflexota bacterium]